MKTKIKSFNPPTNQSFISKCFLLMEKGGDQQHNEEQEEVVVVAQLHDEGGAFSMLAPVTGGISGGLGPYDKPLLCCGCGIGWFSFLMGFVFPPLWYFATILYIGNYYQKDPRERPGLAASAIAALICSVAAIIFLLIISST